MITAQETPVSQLLGNWKLEAFAKRKAWYECFKCRQWECHMCCVAVWFELVDEGNGLSLEVFISVVCQVLTYCINLYVSWEDTSWKIQCCLIKSTHASRKKAVSGFSFFVSPFYRNKETKCCSDCFICIAICNWHWHFTFSSIVIVSDEVTWVCWHFQGRLD